MPDHCDAEPMEDQHGPHADWCTECSRPSYFTLTIKLGNDAMQDSNDVAAALHTVASYLRGSGDWDDTDAGKIRDANGNTVGEWEAK